MSEDKAPVARSSYVGYLAGRWGLIGGSLLGGTSLAYQAWTGGLHQVWPFGIPAVVMFAIGIWTHDRAAYVELFPRGVRVVARGLDEMVPWGEITSLAPVQGTSSPTFRIRFSDGRAPVYCSVVQSYASLNVMGMRFSRDMSGFEEAARRLRQEESIRLRKAEKAGAAGNA